MPAPRYERIEKDALRILDVLCRQPSVSAEGRALDETADVVEELLAETGFDVRQLRANEHIRLDDVGHAVRFTYALFERLAEA